ncbi:hypothetical protein Hanom_Chr13g01218711 [Helianthus anomalus]
MNSNKINIKIIPGKRVGFSHGSKRVRVETDSGQNGSIKKWVVLVRVETGLGQNGFGLERVRVGTSRVRTSFRSGWVG